MADALASLLRLGAVLQRLATGAAWSEGPVWMPQLDAVRWSDIPGDRILQHSTVFPQHFPPARAATLPASWSLPAPRY